MAKISLLVEDNPSAVGLTRRALAKSQVAKEPVVVRTTSNAEQAGAQRGWDWLALNESASPKAKRPC
jgi:hypothetical protein